ncbi:MAG: FAD-binding oxidoreductase [Actinomycetaceae bacterium]|nr:FAD-binding oxidoreductase [Actinomycetaceae bacterium]
MGHNITASIERSVWWGWGQESHPRNIPPAVWPFLKREFGIVPSTQRKDPVPIDSVDVPPSALEETVISELMGILGSTNVKTDRHTRITHASGKSYPDMYRLRTGNARHAPDAVLYPSTEEQIMQIFQAAEDHDLAVVPFGGGTSVVGGLEPLKNGKKAVVCIDMRRFNELIHIDPVSNLARVQAGMRGPELEFALQRQGFTLGHIPQSHQEATIGGYIATRSAGQASTGYGRSDALVRGLTMVSPAGTITLGNRAPSTAAGPQLMEALIGSEGTMGIITEITLEVVEKPTHTEYASWAFASWEQAATAFRRLYQECGPGMVPHVCRLSDEEETRDTLIMAGKIGQFLLKILKARSMDTPCISLFLWEDTNKSKAKYRKRICERVLRAAGGKRLPKLLAEKWESGRFSGPYLRDALMSEGVLVDTLETATTWNNLNTVYRAVQEAIQQVGAQQGHKTLVQCHISHVYRSGASLYYTFLTQENEDPLAQWQAIKTAACQAIVAAGGTITHHHGVGRDHLPYVMPEFGYLGTQILSDMKARLDPHAILNPGKLIPALGNE